MTLADRIEAADGPSRELDAEIAVASGLYVYEKRGKDRQEWFYPTDDRKYTRKALRYGSSGQTLESYSKSIDAAQTLVPEGDSWTLGQNVHHKHWICSVNYLDSEGAPACRGEGYAKTTPAMALCAAALRARGE